MLQQLSESSIIHTIKHTTNMMHINSLRESLQKNDVPFDCGLWKANGEKMFCRNVVCTSTFFDKDTANLLFVESREIRKVRIKNFFEFNNQEIYL